jgi:membrane fusion protein, multidrug efflux system
MMRKPAFATIAVIAVAGVAWFAFHRSPSAQPAATPAQVSALVKTQSLQRQNLTDSVTAFGDVMTGQVVAISFPRAGQVSQLLVVPNQLVKSGTPLATLTSDPNAKLAYAQAASAVDFSGNELRRNEELFSLQLATQSQVDSARKALLDAEAYLAAQQQLGGDVGTATVAAPFNGVIVAVNVAQGDRIQPGTAILQLGRTDVLRVQLGIEPDDAHLVHLGMPVTLSPVSDFTKTVSVSIEENQGIVDSKTQLVDAVTTVPAARATFLVPGMHVRATIKVGQHLAWAVPREAVLTDANGAYIFQVADGKARRVKVTTAGESQAIVAISGNIDAQLPVVVVGNYELADGMLVREGP